MNSQFYHLAVLLIVAAFLGLIIVTGHDNSPLLSTLLTGALGGAAPGTLRELWNGVTGEGPAPSNGGKQAGYIRSGIYPWIVFLGALLAGSAILFLHGCSVLGKSDPVATSCAAASAAIKTVTSARASGLLNQKEIQAVDSAIASVQPVCSSPTEPLPNAAAISVFNSAVLQLEAAATAHPLK